MASQHNSTSSPSPAAPVPSIISTLQTHHDELVEDIANLQRTRDECTLSKQRAEAELEPLRSRTAYPDVHAYVQACRAHQAFRRLVMDLEDVRLSLLELECRKDEVAHWLETRRKEVEEESDGDAAEAN